jgi:ABC-2 type transport system ATP-binding protein
MNLLLEVSELSKTYGEKQVVQKIKFAIREGEILGFLGPNGAGKSTTIKMLADVETKDSGEILFRGQNVDGDRKTWKRSLGVVPQDIAVYEDISAYDNVKFFCSLYGFRGRELMDRTREALEFAGLWER